MNSAYILFFIYMNFFLCLGQILIFLPKYFSSEISLRVPVIYNVTWRLNCKSTTDYFNHCSPPVHLTYTVIDFYVPYLFGFIHTFYIFFTISPYILDFQWEIICFCYEIIIFISVCASDGIFNLILSEGIFGFVLKS